MKLKGISFFMGLFLFGCVVTPQSAVWKTVPESSISYDKAWNIVVNGVTQYFEIETIDGQSGYLRSAWKVTKRVPFFNDPMKQSRVHVRVESRNPFRVKVKAEQQVWDDFGSRWVEKGNDEKIESEILQEISARLRR